MKIRAGLVGLGILLTVGPANGQQAVVPCVRIMQDINGVRVPSCQAVSADNPLPVTAGTLMIRRVLVTNDTNPILIDPNPGQLFGIEAYNNGTTIAYVKLYDGAQTCGTDVPIYEGMIPGPTAGGPGNPGDHYISMNSVGAGPFQTAITACVTTGIGDADMGAPPANTYVIDFYYR